MCTVLVVGTHHRDLQIQPIVRRNNIIPVVQAMKAIPKQECPHLGHYDNKTFRGQDYQIIKKLVGGTTTVTMITTIGFKAGTISQMGKLIIAKTKFSASAEHCAKGVEGKA